MMHPGLENIITAILKNAITEYDNAVGYIEKHPEPITTKQKNKIRERENEILDCEKFFRSSWFNWLYEVNPEELISAIRMRDKSKAIDWNDEDVEEVEE